MTKEEIIEGILKGFRIHAKESKTPLADEANHVEEIIATLEVSLKGIGADANIRTCEDFSYLNVDCCVTCHTFYPHYEMCLIDLENGGDAWICCAMDRALNPTKRTRLEQSLEHKQILNMSTSNGPISPELITAYLTTEYRVAANPPFALLMGKRSEPLAILMAERGVKSAAYITAYNPPSQRVTEEENWSAHNSLRRNLEKRGFVLIEAEGADPSGGWQTEPGFLVLGLTLEHAKEIGKLFRQNAIVCADKDAVPELMMLVE